jgi:hypothetical protein
MGRLPGDRFDGGAPARAEPARLEYDAAARPGGAAVRAVLDGELVAFGPEWKPDFPSVCERMLHRQARIPITFMIFDVLRVDGRDVRRRRIASVGGSSRDWGLRVPNGGCRMRSTMAARSGLQFASTSSKVPSRNDSTSLTCPASAAG